MRSLKKVTAVTLLAEVCMILAAGCKNSDAGEMRDMTTQEIVEDMGLGINLGNTFETFGWAASTVRQYETGWGSPVITQEMIQGYADCGFGVLRL